ncbi:MAG: glutathione S-transferase family protein [Deltaproteobacteria bacterium]|nr:glutathione S-transferase family protein [Deltaproteobacteria bacterium]
MKLYVFSLAPNPKKLLVYLKEKGLDVPCQEVDITQGANRTEEFLRKNPLGGLPVLELDDGSCLTESLAIIEYLEELHPTPSMIGGSPMERARTREVERIADIGVLTSVGTIFQNTSPFFAGRVKQSAEAAANARTRLANALGALEKSIGSKPFAAGDRPTIADCTLVAALQFGEFAGVDLDPTFQNLHRWYGAFKQRPSVQG